MKTSGLLAAVLFAFPLSTTAQDLSPCLVGKWTNSLDGSYVWFLGEGIGRESGRYFHYECSSDQVTLNYGGGSNVTFEAVCGAGQLELASGATTNVYGPAATTLSSCATNLMRVEGAVAVFIADRPGAMFVTFSDLVPAYISSLPACDGDGAYVIGSVEKKPYCTVHGMSSD